MSFPAPSITLAALGSLVIAGVLSGTNGLAPATRAASPVESPAHASSEGARAGSTDQRARGAALQRTTGSIGWGESCDIEVVPPSTVAPVAWRPCAGLGATCAEMAADWDHEGSAFGVTPRFQSSVRGQSEASLVVSRLALHGAKDAESSKEWVVAGLDGAVHFAMRHRFRGEPSCTMVEESASAGGIAFVVRGDGRAPLQGSLVDGLVVVDPSAGTARIAFRNRDADISGFAVGGRAIARVVAPARRTELLHLDGSFDRVLHDPDTDPDSLPAAGATPLFVGDDVVFEVGAARARAVHVLDHVRGVRPLLRWPSESDHGAGNVGTDGDVLVWSEGEGRDDDGEYARARVMAAAFTTDPASLHPREVAADPNHTIGDAPFVVGCGRAAHETPAGPIVVDLATGATTHLPHRDGVTWGRPIGLTCDEAFVTTFQGARANVARVRLR